MKTAFALAKAGVDLWIAISVLSVALSCPVDAAEDDLVVGVVASCEAMLKEYCPGAYGFRITEPGVFIAGPSSEGPARNGQAVETPAIRAGAPGARRPRQLEASRVPCSGLFPERVRRSQ